MTWAQTSLSTRVRIARKALGLTTTAVDRAAGLTRGHCWLIESGTRRHIEDGTARKLATALGLTLDWLLAGIGPGPAIPAPTESGELPEPDESTGTDDD